MDKIKLDDFTKYKFLSGIQFSPNGNHACFVLHSTKINENSYSSNLWLYDIEKKNYFQLTNFNKETNFIWLKDNHHIIFPETRNPLDQELQEKGEKFTDFYKININGGEAGKFFRINKEVTSIKEVNENYFVFTATSNQNEIDLEPLSHEEKARELKLIEEERDYEILDEIPFWSNGKGFTNKNRNQLYLYNLSTNKTEELTDTFMDVESFQLSEDGSLILFIGTYYKDKMELQNAIYTINLKNKKVESLTPNDTFSYSYADFISDTKVICTGTDMKSYGLNENHKFYLIDILSKNQICLTPDFDKDIGNSIGSDCRYGSGKSILKEKNYLYFITTEGDSSFLNRVDKNGIIERIIGKKGSVDDFTVKNNHIIFIGLRGIKLQELYSLENESESQITYFNEWVQKDRKISVPEELKIKINSNIEIDGWVIKPIDFNPTKKYPAILDIHGGPKTAYGEVFFHEMQYWASQGYAVFFCNPRGSSGKGDAFADIRGKYGTIDYDDIMNFTDTVINRYNFIDPDNICVTGGSYGGYMTNWIIGHTDRFKAAASQRSISNWITEFCTTDIGYYFVDDQISSTPWGNPEKLWNHSPLKYADKVKTPTLFLHSEEDYRCWLPESIQMFTALKYHGIDSRLCIIRGENHELSRSGKPKHRIKRLTEITQWFNKYIGK